MHASIHAGITNRAISDSGPTRRAQTQVPAWQQQHHRLLHPAAPAHPLHRRRCRRVLAVLRHNIAPAAGISIFSHRGSSMAALTHVGHDLFEVVAKVVGGGFVGLCQVPPELILRT